MSQIKCYVINLATANERRQAIVAPLKSHGIDYELFQAVDGKQLTQTELSQHFDPSKAEKNYGAISLGEIGTSLSHIGIYRDMVHRQIPYAVILEDDVSLSHDFCTFLQTSHDQSLTKLFSCDQSIMVQLTHISRYYRLVTRRLGSYKVVRPHSAVWLTSGYFITLAAAKKLIAGLYPVWAVADYWQCFEKQGFVRVHALVPHCVWEASRAKNSSLSKDRQPRRKARRDCKFYLTRLIDQIFIRPFLVKKQKNIKATTMN